VAYPVFPGLPVVIFKRDTPVISFHGIYPVAYLLKRLMIECTAPERAERVGHDGDTALFMDAVHGLCGREPGRNISGEECPDAHFPGGGDLRRQDFGDIRVYRPDHAMDRTRSGDSILVADQGENSHPLPAAGDGPGIGAGIGGTPGVHMHVHAPPVTGRWLSRIYP